MLNNAYITVGIKDLWTQKANSIAGATDEMSKSLEAFDKKFISTKRTFDLFERKLSNTDRSLEKTQKKFNELHKLSPVNLSNLVNENLSKEMNEIDKLKRKIESVDARMTARRDPTNKIHEVDALKKQLREKQAEERNQLSGKTPKQVQGMGMIGGFIAGATGVSFLRSATRNATEFDTALYDINRQLGDDENIKDYIKFIDKYALKTGRARVEIAQQTAELLKTRKVGEGLDMIGDKIEIMTYATNQLELDTLTAAQTAEILGDAYKMTGNELKGAFAQANMMEDIYGSLVAGSDIAKIISRNIPLLSNAKIVPKEQALSLSTFAKANTSLEGISVGTALDRIMRGGDKAYGGGFTKRAESTGKTALDIIMQDAEKYNELQTQAKKNEFVLSRLDRANAEDIQVLNSIFKETSSINSARLQSFLKVQKQYEQGTINSIEYRKELEKLNKAERTIAASLLSSEKALKDFNRTIQLIGDRHDATLGRISESWKMVSGAFGNQVLFPALNLLADGLERIAPTVTMLINDYPTLMKVLAGAGAVAGIVAIVNSFTMLRNALLGVALGLNTIAKSKAFWLLTAAGVAYDVISSKYNKFQESLTPEQRSKWSENEKMMKEQGLNPKQMNEKREALKKEFNGQEASRQTVFAPPMSGTQSRPTQGSIDIRLMTDDKTQAIVDVKKEDGTFLNILQPTKTRN